jgi:hypothetical protein
LVDKLNTTTVGQALERDFLFKLSTGFLYDCLEYAVRKYDGAAFRAKVLSEFSGSLCVDQIHLGHRVVLLASDPVSDNPIACALVSKNDAAHMLRFLRNLKNHGFSPQTVISDRSPLYPKAIAEVWPDANHQLCVFHVISEVNDQRAQCSWRDQTNAQAQANQTRTRSAKQTQSSTGQEIEEATRAS